MTKPPDLRRDAVGRETVTLADVANAAGVSASTVSYVITGKRPISPRTRRKVLESIRALGYRRPGDHSSPARNRVGVLAIALPRHSERNAGIETEFIAGATEAARSHHLDLLLLTHDRGSAGLHRVSYSALADAAIVMDVEVDDARLPPLLASHLPAVLVGGEPGEYPGLSHVGFDHAAAGAACVTHLTELGHRSIVHIGPPSRMVSSMSFLEGFRNAAARRAVRASSHLCGLSEEEITPYVSRLLASEAPTGLVVDNEAALPLVLAAVEDRGLRIPADVSVIAVCSETVARRQRIPLTTMVVPGRTLGTLAVEHAARPLDIRTTVSVELLAPQITCAGRIRGVPRTDTGGIRPTQGTQD